MAAFMEAQIASIAVTASGQSLSVSTGAVNYPAPPKVSVGFTSAFMFQEITAVSSLTTWDENLQGLPGNQTSWANLYDATGKLIQFPTATGTGVVGILVNGVIPASLRTNFTLVGTSVTRNINFTLGG